ncbi:MAG: hypothetical protein AAB368_15890, partial [bacterium]
MRTEFRDSLEFVFPDTRPGHAPGVGSELDVARGGTAAVHVLVTGAPRGPLGVGVAEGGKTVRGARWFKLRDVPVEANTGPVIFTETRESGRNSHVIRRAPFRVYDAMEPVDGACEFGGSTGALRLHLPGAPDARPGLRRYTVTVGKAPALELAVRVHGAVLPPSGAASFPYTNWFDVRAMATRHGLKEWSEAHWSMIRKYAEVMRHGRQNMFWVPLHCVFRRQRGAPVLDRARLRRYVDTFTRAGLPLIEGGHVGTRSGGWKAKAFSTVLNGPPAASPAGDRDLRAICAQLTAEIDRNGWRGRWTQHVADEPQPALAADY